MANTIRQNSAVSSGIARSAADGWRPYGDAALLSGVTRTVGPPHQSKMPTSAQQDLRRSKNCP